MENICIDVIINREDNSFTWENSHTEMCWCVYPRILLCISIINYYYVIIDHSNYFLRLHLFLLFGRSCNMKLGKEYFLFLFNWEFLC